MEILKFSEPPKRSSRSASARKSGLMPMVTFGIAVLVLGGMSTTLAGTISLGTGNTVEFGQGVVTTAACDESIRVVPTSSFDTSTGQTYSGFHVSQIQLAGIGVAATDTTTASQITAGCLGKKFTLKGYDSSGNLLNIFDNSTTANLSGNQEITFRLSSDTATAFSTGPTFTDKSGGLTYQSTGDWKALTTTSPTSAGTNTGIVTIIGFKTAATLTRITVETSQ
jgi:hypothetical protein